MRQMPNEVKVMKKHLGRANEIPFMTSRRHRQAFLLSVMPPKSDEYNDLLKSVCQYEIIDNPVEKVSVEICHGEVGDDMINEDSDRFS